MATVAETPTIRKPAKAYYCHFHDEAGYLTKFDGDLLFLADGSTTPHVIEPEDVCWLAVLGEVGTAVQQFVADQLAGGYASVACGRDEGRN
jgi:hypothetical protein